MNRILRKFGMLLQKPYPYDYRRPANCEKILMERLERTLGLLSQKGINMKDIAIGFFDKSSPLIDVIEGSFYKFICSLSFAQYWIEKFFNPSCLKFSSG